MKNSYLIQRLLKPYQVKNRFTELGNMFSFGGGLVRGGLSKEAWELLHTICRFDYMGAAEFEFGAVPEALSTLVSYGVNLTAFSFPVKFKYRDWKKQKDITGEKSVYVICNSNDVEEIKSRIKQFAVNNPEMRTKERVNLDSNLGGYEYSQDNVGWLELDNGYMFFTEEKMWDEFRLVLGEKKSTEVH